VVIFWPDSFRESSVEGQVGKLGAIFSRTGQGCCSVCAITLFPSFRDAAVATLTVLNV